MKDRLIRGLKAGLVTYFIVFLIRTVTLIAFSVLNTSDKILFWPAAIPGILTDMMIYGVVFGVVFGLIYPKIPFSGAFRKSIVFALVIYIIIGIPLFTAVLPESLTPDEAEVYSLTKTLSEIWWMITMISVAVLLGYFYDRFKK